MNAISNLDDTAYRRPLETTASYNGASVSMHHAKGMHPWIRRFRFAHPSKPIGGDLRPLIFGHRLDHPLELLTRLKDDSESVGLELHRNTPRGYRVRSRRRRAVLGIWHNPDK